MVGLFFRGIALFLTGSITMMALFFRDALTAVAVFFMEYFMMFSYWLGYVSFQAALKITSESYGFFHGIVENLLQVMINFYPPFAGIFQFLNVDQVLTAILLVLLLKRVASYAPFSGRH